MPGNDHLISPRFSSPETLVDSLPGPPVRTMLVRVTPRDNSHGHNDDVNQFVHDIFNQITKHPKVIAFRLGWQDTVFFDTDRTDLLGIALPVLSERHSEIIQNQMIIRGTTGPRDIRLHQVDEMSLELTKVDQWDIHLFDHYYENGVRHVLYT